MTWIISAVLIFIAALFIADMLIAAPKYKDNNSNHFDGKCFVNPDDAGNHHYLEVLKWWFSKNDKGEWPKIAQGDLPKFRLPEKRVSLGDLHVTFINHATFLIQVDGLNILTDPIWSDRASPYNWIGPKRQHPPGLKFEDLPPIDLVLISHNHYDHLDLKTVRQLHREHNPQFVVPLGVEQFLDEHDVTLNTHLDWWDEYRFNDKLSLTAVPARHFSGRGLFDRNKTLWCGYVLHTSKGNIYFAGDTGYGSFFKEIGQRFGPMKTSFIPIGAYLPRWFMEAIHISPEEALQVHKDVQSQKSFAMHFGTFPMADDGMHDAAEALRKILNADETGGEFKVLKEGETKVVESSKQISTVGK
ncbi:MAG TPA: MBL fold metallo-hydrolase [Balneolaceae bacterium]